MSSTGGQQLEYEGVTLQLPAGVAVSFKSGALALKFENFTGEIGLTPSSAPAEAMSPQSSRNRPYRWDTQDPCVAALLNESPDPQPAPALLKPAPALEAQSSGSRSQQPTDPSESLPLGQQKPRMSGLPEPTAGRWAGLSGSRRAGRRSLLDNIVSDQKAKQSAKQQPVTNEKVPPVTGAPGS